MTAHTAARVTPEEVSAAMRWPDGPAAHFREGRCNPDARDAGLDREQIEEILRHCRRP